MLSGNLRVLGSLDNLVSLDVSNNKFSGNLPNTKLFHDLPSSAFAGNQELCINRSQCNIGDSLHGRRSTKNLVLCAFLSVTATMLILLFGVLLIIRARGTTYRGNDEEEKDLEWDFTPFQKLNFSVNDIVTKLLDSNIIGKEYGYSLKITEKSDVYSYGVVLLEVLTGKEPTDNQIPEGAHIITWVNKELKERKKDFTTILDQQLLMQSSTQIQEMLQVLGVALLSVNSCPEERPTMKDVTAMLKEIRHENDDFEKPISLGKVVTNPKAAVHCSSFSRSSEPLIRSPS
ncbi:hypothetical protein JRO89_XS07G0215600 [Xanthoceras sorbifolium]|uniref:Protein kinase domain-containing protein n=1 Tax=Xanthoceras sorbifolium TaxID=99658 RepID=A0ABQ8HUJ6_9ROSI|nr:hypothetical protein JRO89_XS07G0215600 [Xanthoceras sorbifolium]